jgi:DNA-binding LacI/PurR family transcriptional regulator
MNIREVARLAMVSTATVSRTINGSEKVTEETAKRVRAAIKKLRYYPNTNARALGSGRSNLYGLIISDITNPFFPELVKSFEDIAVQYGQEILVANTGYDPHRTEQCVTRMLQRKVDGVAIMTSEMDPRTVVEFEKRGIPLVFLDTAKPRKNISTVRIDYRAAIEAALDHLCALGHSRIAFIAGSPKHQSSRLRREAFIQSLKRRQIRLPAGYVVEGLHTIAGGHEAMLHLLRARKKPTAVIASNDLSAIGALGAIHASNVEVPGDISLVGIDDIAISAFTHPPLTTVRLSRATIARAAFQALYRNGSEGGPAEHRIEPALIVRSSTAPPK